MTTSSQTRGVIALGEVSPALTNTLEYVSISTQQETLKILEI
jgi:hypothetical protein